MGCINAGALHELCQKKKNIRKKSYLKELKTKVVKIGILRRIGVALQIGSRIVRSAFLLKKKGKRRLVIIMYVK